ncbi:MAG: hypothetical protein IJS40_00670 [Synergistaceae bacterium]|nr:hypothetical protein [Synergistaceae bacterium]
MKIKVVKSFSYYIDGYKLKNFVPGEYEVKEDVAKYARESGFLYLDKESEGSANAAKRAGNAGRGKNTMSD